MKIIKFQVRQNDDNISVDVRQFETVDEAADILGIDEILKRINYIESVRERSKVRKQGK